MCLMIVIPLVEEGHCRYQDVDFHLIISLHKLLKYEYVGDQEGN